MTDANRGNLKGLSTENLLMIFAVLGLSENERKVIVASSFLPKTTSLIARHVDLPRSTVQDIIKELDKRGLIMKFKGLGDKKSPRWKSNIERSIRQLYRIVAAKKSHPHVLNIM